jgi:hypothetical protein
MQITLWMLNVVKTWTVLFWLCWWKKLWNYRLGQKGCRGWRLPYFLDMGHMQVVRLSVLPLAAFTSQDIFLVPISVKSLSRSQSRSASGRNKSMKNPNDLTGNWTRDLPANCTVAQPTVSPYTALLMKCTLKFICIALNVLEQISICIFYFLCTRYLRLWFVYVVFRRCRLLSVLVQRLAVLTEAF